MYTEYTFIKEYNDEAFIREVNGLLQVGWQPIGDITVTQYPNGDTKFYIQCMGKLRVESAPDNSVFRG